MNTPLKHTLVYRISVLFAVLVLCHSSLAAPLPDSIAQKSITLHGKKISVTKILDNISAQTGLIFSYQVTTISKIEKLSFFQRTLTLETFLKEVFLPKNIVYTYIFPNVIVLKPAHISPPEHLVVSGLVSDSLSGEKLTGSSITLNGKNVVAISNSEGFYSFQTQKDSLVMQVSFVGYNPKEIRMKLEANLRLDIALSPSVFLQLVSIQSSADDNTVIQESGNNIKLKGRQISELSPLFGESDVFRTLQLLPGIQSVGEGTPGLHVRGGSPDQNLVLLDGVQLYNPVHIFGFYSVFNPGIVKNVSLNKGPFPAKHGGRLSSVIDVITKDGNNRKIQGEGMLGIMGSRLLIEGPIGKSGKTTFLASARRSHIDLLLSPFIDGNLSTQNAGFLSAYFFYDLNGKVVHRFNKNSKLTLSFYNGRDKVALNNSFKLDNPQRQISEKDLQQFTWGNTVAYAKWSRILSPKAILRVSAWYSSYNFGNRSKYSFTETHGTDSLQENFFDYRFQSRITDVGTRADFDFFLTQKWSLNVGAHVIFHTFQPGVTTLASNLPNLEPARSIPKASTGTESATYLDNKIKIGKKTELNAGVHLSLFTVNGAEYTSLQPRLSAKTHLTKHLILSAGYSQMQQFMHLLTNSTIGIPRDLWILSSENIAPQTNRQLNLSIKYEGTKLNAGVDLFSKNMNNVLEYKDEANYLKNTSNWEEKTATGTGNSIGIEFYAEKTWGRFTGWIGYCISKSTRQFDEINNGKPFLFRYDRRHDLSSTVTYQINKRNSISANFIFATGTPITLPEQVYSGMTSGQPFVIDVYVSGKRNDFILPNYHRLDLNYSNYKQNKLGRRIWSIGFYNTYNRHNPFFIAPAYNEQGERVLRQVTLFPIIPSLTYRQEF